MTDATNTTNDESFIEKIEDGTVAAWHGIEGAFGTLESKFEADVWPSVKAFLITLTSQIGQAALKSAIVALPTLAAGGFGAAAAEVGAAVVATASVDAPIDAQVALQSVQAALQVVKVANGTVTAGDAATVAAIAAAAPAPVAQEPAA